VAAAGAEVVVEDAVAAGAAAAEADAGDKRKEL
jgi:hypothetical protein